MQGQRLTARDLGRQVVEIEVRAALLSGFSALRILVTEAAEKAYLGIGESCRHPVYVLLRYSLWPANAAAARSLSRTSSSHPTRISGTEASRRAV